MVEPSDYFLYNKIFNKRRSGVIRLVNIKYYFVVIVVFLAGCGQNDPSAAKPHRPQAVIDRGRELYLGNGCAVCHGKEGLGNGLSAERYYPRPANLTDPAAYTLGASVTAIQQTVKKGIKKENNTMPAYEHLTNSELYAIAVFLESIQVKPDGAATKEQTP